MSSTESRWVFDYGPTFPVIQQSGVRESSYYVAESLSEDPSNDRGTRRYICASIGEPSQCSLRDKTVGFVVRGWLLKIFHLRGHNRHMAVLKTDTGMTLPCAWSR